MCLYHVVMTHLSIDGHLDCFYFLTTLKNAAMNMQCKYLFQTLLSISLNQCPEIGLLLDHMIFYFNVFRTAIVFSIALAPFSIPTNSAQECHLLHILTMACYFMFFCFLNSSYPDGCEVVSRGFDLHFPNDE